MWYLVPGPSKTLMKCNELKLRHADVMEKI